jgi:hypothetical protein
MRLYADKRAAGVCVWCSAPTVDGAAHCPKHLIRRREMSRANQGNKKRNWGSHSYKVEAKMQKEEACVVPTSTPNSRPCH